MSKLMPNLDQQSTKVLNLTVLQRIDPFVEEILMTAAHVTFYEFNIELNQWSRKDVEGSLFVVKRNTQPRFQFIVMNRRNTDNLVEDLLGDFEYEVQVPYLLYRNANQEVNGIWFYNSHDCEAIANLFSSEFEELEATPSLSVMEGPLEPPTSSVATVSDIHEEPLVNFFSTLIFVYNGSFMVMQAAMNMGNASQAGVAVQQRSSAPIPLSSHISATLPPASTIQTPPSLPNSSAAIIPLLDTNESSSGSNLATNLVKPSLFANPPVSSQLMMPPITSFAPTAPPLHPPLTMQRPYGTPLLQPFPPPTPPPSLTPTPNYAPVISRDKIRDALLKLVQLIAYLLQMRHEWIALNLSWPGSVTWEGWQTS
ncbi:mRNA-decapping enzyme-like protein [Apostasia shenzhenica]|uniref:mRNA-decapping enzyme-like protein n=1 Tax=Apostasia shenzhenica TaxID=1088818 RepID=A0A2H9ZW60_9ASPA|nr:mRNA-decapping enzyme-like protein [Apostasia shenzhenica]